MAIARPNAPSARVVVDHAARQSSRTTPDVNPVDDPTEATDDAAADFVDWASDVGVVALGGSAVGGVPGNESDGAAIRLRFRARQDFKSAFFACLKTGAAVIEHPQQTDSGDILARLRDPDGHFWDLTAPA